MSLTSGKRLGHYEINSRLGAGGMGEVYSAHDLHLDRKVAVKILAERIADNVDALRRFEKEAKAVASLSHPNILDIHDFGSEEGVYYAVTELLEGQTLRSRITRSRLFLREALEIAIAVSEGLAAAHSKGIIHRDLKPENIFLTTDGRVKILDFGLARLKSPEPQQELTDAVTVSKLTQAGVILGTLPYMSPEQVRGDTADERSDIFSFGCVLYEMISGSLAFSGTTASETMAAILRDDAPSLPEVQPQINQIIQHCLEKVPERRLQSARDLCMNLRDMLHDSQSSHATFNISPQAVTKHPSLFRIPVIAMALGILMILMAALLYRWQGGNSPAFGKKETTAVSPVPSLKNSIAVLPLTNMSPSNDDEYFSDGMTESIITNLGKLPGILVIARNSTIQYKGLSVDIKKVGRDLNVRYVLEGSVQRASNELRVNVQLIDANNGYQVWAERYDSKMKDIFAVQDDISSHIVSSLKLALAPARPGNGPPTANVKAYDTYLQGLFFQQRPSRQNYATAIHMFEEAVALDPKFALAHALLAVCYANLYSNYDPDKQWEEKAFAETQKALSLDPNLAEAYWARATLTWTPSNHFPHEEAIQYDRRAVELNHNLAPAHAGLGVVYKNIGLLDLAMDELNVALRIDPNNLNASNQIAWVYLFEGQYQKVLDEWEKHPALATHIRYAAYNKVLALDHLGRRKEAFDLVAEVLKQEPEYGMALADYAVLLAENGDRTKSVEQITQAIQFGEGKGHFPYVQYYAGVVFTLMDQKDKAIEWLEKAANDGLPCYPLYANDSYLNNLRSEPRFISLMQKLKMKWEYYKKTYETKT